MEEIINAINNFEKRNPKVYASVEIKDNTVQIRYYHSEGGYVELDRCPSLTEEEVINSLNFKNNFIWEQ